MEDGSAGNNERWGNKGEKVSEDTYMKCISAHIGNALAYIRNTFTYMKNAFYTKDSSTYMKNTAATKADKGSITVEASIIIPLVILSIAAAIYMGLLLYQKSLVQSAVQASAEAGAAAWASGSLDVDMVKPIYPNFNNYKLYRRIYDGSSKSRLRSIEEYALKLSSHNELIKPVHSEAKAIIKDYIVYKRIEVEICKCYSIPLGRFLKLFGGNETIGITVKAASVIDDPVEVIRTTDFIIDLERKLERRFPELRDIRVRINETMKDIKDKLNGFLE